MAYKPRSEPRGEGNYWSGFGRFSRRDVWGGTVYCIHQGKIIYDTESRAVKASRHLRKREGRVLNPYQCPEADDGHYHLTSQPRKEGYNA